MTMPSAAPKTKEEKPSKEQAVALETIGVGKVDAVVTPAKGGESESTELPKSASPPTTGTAGPAAGEEKEKDVGKEKESPAKEESEGKTDPDAPVPVIDMDTFSQILEMDDDDTHEFSLSIVENYMEQAEATFGSMAAALEQENLPELSRLGHFLKGSSAALGISQVQTGCEAMQYYGQLKRGANGARLEPKEALELITPLLAKIKEGHTEADKWLRDFYGVESWGTGAE